MKPKIKKILLLISLFTTTILCTCTGPSSMSVGVGIGVPRPYGVPPAGGSIWIGRPIPQTIYNKIPLETEIRYVHNKIIPAIAAGEK
jgi:hypothetical protein